MCVRASRMQMWRGEAEGLWASKRRSERASPTNTHRDSQALPMPLAAPHPTAPCPVWPHPGSPRRLSRSRMLEQVQAEVEEERKKLVAAEKERLTSEQEDRMLLEQRAKDAASQQRLKELEARVSLARGKGASIW